MFDNKLIANFLILMTDKLNAGAYLDYNGINVLIKQFTNLSYFDQFFNYITKAKLIERPENTKTFIITSKGTRLIKKQKLINSINEYGNLILIILTITILLFTIYLTCNQTQ